MAYPLHADIEDAEIYEAIKAKAAGTPMGELIDRIEAGWDETPPGGGRHWLFRVV